MVISVSELTKHYSVAKKEPGILGTFKMLFSRKEEIVKAVDSVSFSITAGELVGFIGPNGAGKTTTLKCLSGLLYPTRGTVSVLGHTPFKRDFRFLKEISLVMGQKNQLWWDLPAMDTFLLNKEVYGISDQKFQKIVSDLSELLEATEFLQTPVRKLSLGQRMKMELIAALIHQPKVLFLDEPTIGLDVVMQKKIREFLKEYNKQYNATILLTSHYMADVEELCKRVIIINFGKILYDGLLSDLVKKHAPHKFISVILEKPLDQKKRKAFGETKKYEFPEWIVKTSQNDSNKIAAKILQECDVKDITIEDPDIEDVIREVFMEKV